MPTRKSVQDYAVILYILPVQPVHYPTSLPLMASSTFKFNPDTDIADLTGKVVLVAGGNAGIGYETVKELARHGAHVYLGARNESRATGALAKLKSEGVPDGRVEWLPLDLATPSTTKAGAEEFLRRAKRLDILGESRYTGSH